MKQRLIFSCTVCNVRGFEPNDWMVTKNLSIVICDYCACTLASYDDIKKSHELYESMIINETHKNKKKKYKE